jgi:hypothetical protein
MMDWRVVLPWLFWLSVLTFFGSLVVLPILIIRLPADYFVRTSPAPESWRMRHPLVRLVVLIVKNLLGLIFLLAGLVMIFTPGQGILSVLVGVSLMDLPGKKAWERRIVARPHVHRVLNLIRNKAGAAPLEVPAHDPSGSAFQDPPD